MPGWIAAMGRRNAEMAAFRRERGHANFFWRGGRSPSMSHEGP